MPIFNSSVRFSIQHYAPHTHNVLEPAEIFQAQELGRECAQMIKTALKSRKALFSLKENQAVKVLQGKIISLLSRKSISQQSPLHQQVITCCLDNFTGEDFHNKKNPISRKQVELFFYTQTISGIACSERSHYDNALSRIHGAYSNASGVCFQNHRGTDSKNIGGTFPTVSGDPLQLILFS